MESNKFFHSVYLDEDLCQGCVNCIKRCPTEAIRVWDGKAHILKQFCIDCGECVRICSHHAKRIRRDSLDVLSQYEYTVALPPPSLYAQFNNLEDVNILLTALLYLGFDDVYEVPAAAEMVSAAARAYVSEHREDWPYISTACPTVVRLIRIRFPNLIDHLLICCIVRDGRVITPSGKDVLKPNDTVIIVTTHLGLTDIEDIINYKQGN